MRDLDRRYRQASGLSERRFYSIFYSRVEPCPILLLGYNPGGDPATWTEDALASRHFYEGGVHEYADRDYPIAAAMRDFLIDTLELDDAEEIRTIPKSNLIFRRSSASDQLKVPARAAALEAQPFVSEILERVQPETIILEGATTARSFIDLYCRDIRPLPGTPVVTTPNGRSLATIFRADAVHVDRLDADATLLRLGHPSRYARRGEWADVVAAAKPILQRSRGRATT